MSILVTGSTGTIGSQVLSALAGQSADIRALTRSPDTARMPTGVRPVRGDLADIESMRAALQGVSTLFLLAPNVPDELTQAMLAVNLAREAGVKGIVYLSVFKGETYTDVPHFAGKYTVERMIEAQDLPATILRPAYFIQNDIRQKAPVLGAGIYASPIGNKGLSMVDIRDIGESAAKELIRRDQAPVPLGIEAYNLVGPDALTGTDIAAIWTEVLGRTISYGGDDLISMEQRMKAMLPGWHALDLRLMFARYQSDGAIATDADLEHLTRLLGHPPRSYRAFAADAAVQWANS
ncbi:NmrA/HSCARG family protein [Asticcacaulis benevestitus]|uniref:NmrA family transcriptional regulator n=1 Tax=Asticcacaulis benevestitus DSM 16100 = ATCC BAA-896 TaxID=1121022 RepID=V4NXG4_9CAUL|nr:NmrA/HSCARG family protein [Asticcacaulis benevestitus]ESQ86487.1 NmrA family transcriptional regulator [Asticcacaulis benevestitus DSM 16100 = ATCC BAA-896]